MYGFWISRRSTFFRWKKNLNQVQKQMFWNIPFSGRIGSKFILNVDKNSRGNPDSGVGASPAGISDYSKAGQLKIKKGLKNMRQWEGWLTLTLAPQKLENTETALKQYRQSTILGSWTNAEHSRDALGL